MPFLSRRERWCDAGVASRYEERRFRRPLQRLKHRRDEVLVQRLLARAGGPGRVLDLPCGTGRLLPSLVAGGHRVLGADVSREMMAQAVGRVPDGVLFQADCADLPLRSDSVDAVVCLRYLFHLVDRGQRLAVLGELTRVTRGVVIGQVRYRGTWKHAGRWLRSRVGLRSKYAPAGGHSEIALELREAGLELEELWPVSRAFSDKALFLARPSEPCADDSPQSLPKSSVSGL